MVQQYANYAYQISSGDLKFVALLDAENGQRNMYRKSDKVGDNGYYDYGLCQINQWWHPEIVNTKQFWADRKFQIDKCLELYKGWTKFNGKANIPKTIKRFLVVYADNQW